MTRMRSGRRRASVRKPCRTRSWYSDPRPSTRSAARWRRCERRVHRQVQQQRQVRLQAAGGETTDLPELFRVQPGSVTLVGHVGQQEAIGEDHLALRQRRLNDRRHQLGPTGHETKSLGDGRHVAAVMEENLTQFLAQRRAARIDASHDFQTTAAQEFGQEPALGRFAGAVDAVQGKE